MRKDRGHGTQRAIEQHLLGRVGDVVGAPNHVGNAHVDVVHHGGQLIGGQSATGAACTGGTQQNEVLDLVVAYFARAKDGIFELSGAACRRAETYGRALIGIGRLAVAATAATMRRDSVFSAAPSSAASPPAYFQARRYRERRGRSPGVFRRRCGSLQTLGLVEGPSFQSSPSQRRPSRMPCTSSGRLRSTSVSSTRRMKVPFTARAKSQLNTRCGRHRRAGSRWVTARIGRGRACRPAWRSRWNRLGRSYVMDSSDEIFETLILTDGMMKGEGGGVFRYGAPGKFTANSQPVGRLFLLWYPVR